MLEGFNPDPIKDLDGAREAISRLLNLVEALKAQVDQLQTENQGLRDENNRLKGEQGRPSIKPNKKKTGSDNYSSEKERRKPKRRRKQSKNDKIKIDRERVLDVEADILPEDAEFKG